MLNIYNLPGDRFKSDVQRNVVAHARGKFAGIEFAALDHRGGVGADGILFKHGVRAVEKRGYGQGDRFGDALDCTISFDADLLVAFKNYLGGFKGGCRKLGCGQDMGAMNVAVRSEEQASVLLSLMR